MNIIDDTVEIADIIGAPPPGLIPRDYDAVPFGALPYSAPFAEAMPLIPENEWLDRVKAMAGKFPRQLYSDTVNEAEDFQSRLRYCWAFSLAQAVKLQRRLSGQPHVNLAAVSMGGSVGFQNAGNYCGTAIQWAAEHGICDATFPDSQWSLTPSKWKSGWEAEAKNHRVLEYWELGTSGKMFAEVVTALLSGFCVYTGYNWAGHAIALDELVVVKNEICVSSPNTWNKGNRWTLAGSKKTPNEAYVITSGTWSDT